jgi:hypothetical protein
MKIPSIFFSATALVCLAGCASSPVLQTWKAPEHQAGPVKKVAVVAIDERYLVRQGFENRLVRDLREKGQEACVTHDLMGLGAIKDSKEAAADRFRSAGADSVLIVRLADQTTINHEVRATPERYAEVITGIESYGGWYDYYSVAFMDMSTVWGSTEVKVYLQTSLFDLQSGRMLWSALTLTTLKENSDRLEEVDALTSEVVDALRKDGMVH